MASIHKEILIDARPEDVWAAIRDYGAVHQRLAPGFVVDAHLDGDDRIVTFFNGLVARERLISIDDDARRLAYSAVGGRLAHHNGSIQVIDDGEGGSRFRWTIDLLPNELADLISAMMDQGAAAAKQTLELRAIRAS
ncbi:MAG: SRPBCC family protein [Dehalococcoidia bacterium]